MTQVDSMVATWIDPFVAAYQMKEALPCMVAIDRAGQDGKPWKQSRCWGADGTEAGGWVTDPEKRDSDQINYDIADIADRIPHHRPLLDFASDCLDHYLASLPEANHFPAFRVEECYNLIRYKSGQAYHGVHSDYSPTSDVRQRHLSFVMFLNTIDEGGELVFPQQNLFVKPEEGKAVIFPSGWTHAHHTLAPVEQTRHVLQLWWSFA